MSKASKMLPPLSQLKNQGVEILVSHDRGIADGGDGQGYPQPQTRGKNIRAIVAFLPPVRIAHNRRECRLFGRWKVL